MMTHMCSAGKERVKVRLTWMDIVWVGVSLVVAWFIAILAFAI